MFRWDDDQMLVTLSRQERDVLSILPGLLDGVEDGEDAAARLDYGAHPDDPDADAAFRNLVSDDLGVARRRDRATFAETVEAAEISEEAAEAWMRVVGEARLVLAARAGIEEDEWEASLDPSDPGLALLGYLGAVQDQLVQALSARL